MLVCSLLSLSFSLKTHYLVLQRLQKVTEKVTIRYFLSNGNCNTSNILEKNNGNDNELFLKIKFLKPVNNTNKYNKWKTAGKVILTDRVWWILRRGQHDKFLYN